MARDVLTTSAEEFVRKRSRLNLVYAALLFLGIVLLFWQEPRHEWTSLEPDAVDTPAPGQTPAAATATGAGAQL